MSSSSSHPSEREWFPERPKRKDTDHPPMNGDTAWIPALDSHWETVGGLVLTVTDHMHRDTTVAIRVIIENQQQRRTRIDRVHFASAVEQGLFTRLGQVHEAGNRALSPQATERQGTLRQLCHDLNDHSVVSCARIEDYGHHILFAFDVPLVDDPATVPDDIHTLLTNEQCVPLFDTAPDETLTGSREYTRNGWVHHRYVVVDDVAATDSPTEPSGTDLVTGRIDLDIDAGELIGAYTGLPDPVDPYIPLVTAFDLPAEHEQPLRDALAHGMDTSHETTLTIRSHSTRRGRTYHEVVLDPVFNVDTLRETIAEHITDNGGTVFVSGPDSGRVYDGSLTYMIRIAGQAPSRPQTVTQFLTWMLTALPDSMNKTVSHWRSGATFTADVVGLRIQTETKEW